MQRPLFLDLTNSLALLFVCALAQSACFIITPDGMHLPPLAAAGILLLIALVFTQRYLAPAGGPAQIERRARSRARPLGDQWLWSIVTAIAVTGFLLAYLSVYMRLVPQPDVPGDTTEQYAALPLGMVPIIVGAVLVGPLIEEVIMRGWIQGRLSREFGPESAIVNTAALFAVAHLDPWGVGFMFPLGLACGYSVYLTRSIWSGVLIHMTFNASLFVVDHYFPSTDAFPALSAGMQGSMRMAAVMAVSGAIAVIAWRQQRVIRDRTEDEGAEETDGAAQHPD
jgi:membrane protease YdiL (CAAX protease family)